jgi:hypothetical protein
LNADPTTLAEVQAYFGLQSVTPIEKDWQVVRAIRALAAVDTAPFRLVFGGGTALARAHKLIRRMSEDVDFKIVPVADAPTSGAALRRQLGALRDGVSRSLMEAGFVLDSSMPRSRNENRYMLYQLPYEGDVSAAHLRPTIQVELTYSPLRLPAVRMPVASFVAEAFSHQPEVDSVECVAIAETAAEKLVSLTRRTAMQLAGLSRDDDTALIRHVYDLHVLREHYDPSVVSALADEIVHQDGIIFANQYPAYRDQPMVETRKAVEALAAEPIYRERYAAFQRNMVYGNHADYTSALATVEGLVRQLEKKPVAP